MSDPTTAHQEDDATAVAATLAAFRQEAEAASSEVHELATTADLQRLVRERAGAGRVAVAPSFAASAGRDLVDGLRAAGVEVVLPSDPRDITDVEVGVVQGQLAIAESGSVLVAEHDLCDRAVAMLALRCVQVVERSQVRPSLEDAAAWLAERAGQPIYASVVTGPSRTADIERSLTIGVQGPADVDVVVLG